jgi:hypothetical protein
MALEREKPEGAGGAKQEVTLVQLYHLTTPFSRLKNTAIFINNRKPKIS